jgi:tripartite-type tricarboxylate transporter receptor subunit TctC
MALALLAAAAVAQPYPNRPVRIVVPYPPGGGTDVLTRIVGKYLGDSFKQPVVVENRAGANGQIGMDFVIKASPDGYTLLAIAAGPLNEDNLNRFTPIALFAAPAYVLVLHPSVDASSVKGLIALAKSQPGRLAYASSGGGAASHLSMELFKAMTGVELLHIPYKGVGNAVNDLLGGQVQLMLAPSQAVMQHVRSGKLKALAVSGAERSPTLPDLPTISEAGIPGYESAGWFGLIAAAGTPDEIIAKLNQEVNGILQLPEVKARLADLGAAPANLTPQQFLEFIRGDNAKWAKLIKEQGIVIERQ